MNFEREPEKYGLGQRNDTTSARMVAKNPGLVNQKA